MARSTPIQNSFNAGEWSPRMYGRTELDKYARAARQLLNLSITPHGAVTRRSGTRYVAEVKNSAKRTRLVPFIYSDEQAYILEFGDLYVRIFRNEGYLPFQTLSPIPAPDIADVADEIEFAGHGLNDQDGPYQITSTGTIPAGLLGATDYYAVLPPTLVMATTDLNATTDLFTSTAHGLSDQMGPFRLSSNITTPTGLLRSTDYYVVYVDLNTFRLSLNPGGGAVDFTDVGVGLLTMTPTVAYKRDRMRLSLAPGGAAEDITDAGTGTHTLTPVGAGLTTPIEVMTPYIEADLPLLSFAQSADVLYIAHENYEPRKLSRYSPHGFSLEVIDFADGPYLAENTTDTVIVPDAVSGNEITLTASKAIFTGNDVGRPYRYRSTNGGSAVHWGWGKILAVNPIIFTDGDIEGHDFNAAHVFAGAAGYIDIGVNHGMDTGELVRVLEYGTLPNGLAEATDYYVRADSAQRWGFFPTKADAILDTNRIDPDPGGTAAGVPCGRITSSVIDIVSHGYTGGDGPVTLSNSGGGLPAGLAGGTDYYIGFVATDALTLSLSKGGTPKGIDDNQGGGTHTMSSATVPFSSAQASVEGELANTDAKTTWRLGAWGADPALKFPRAVTFFEQRLWWAANHGSPQTIWSSKSGDFENHAPTGFSSDDPTDLDDDVAADNAISYAIGANDVNVINWFAPVTSLLLGTQSRTWNAAAALQGDAIAPANIQVRPGAQKGASSLSPLAVDNRAIYVSATGRRVHSIGYTADSETFSAEDLTLLADHVTKSGVTDMAYANEPWSTVWCVRQDGIMAALALIRDQDISGWSRHQVGGAFVAAYSMTIVASTDVSIAADTVTEVAHGLLDGQRVRWLASGATLPAPFVDNKDYYVRAVDADTLSFHPTAFDAANDTNRIDITTVGSGSPTLGAATNAQVESVAVIPSPAGVQSPGARANVNHDQVWLVVRRTINGVTKRYVEFIEDEFDDDDLTVDAYMVDGGLSRDDTATTSISGLLHLAGEFVDVLADGVVVDDVQVSVGGVVTLVDAAEKVHVGLHYDSDFQGMRLEIPSRSGSTQGRNKRIDHIVLRLNATLGLSFGPDEQSLENLGPKLLPASLRLDTVATPFTGDIEVAFDAGWETHGEVFIRQDRPLPFTLVALLPALQTADRGNRQ